MSNSFESQLSLEHVPALIADALALTPDKLSLYPSKEHLLYDFLSAPINCEDMKSTAALPVWFQYGYPLAFLLRDAADLDFSLDENSGDESDIEDTACLKKSVSHGLPSHDGVIDESMANSIWDILTHVDFDEAEINFSQCH